MAFEPRFTGRRELFHVRLFKGNQHAFWGMTKNILLGIEGRLWLVPMIVVLSVFVNVTPVYCAVAGIIDSNIPLLATAGFTYALQYTVLSSGRSLFAFHRGKALLFPLVVLPVLCCLTRAFYLHSVRGAVHWRGRTITVREGRAKSYG